MLCLTITVADTDRRFPLAEPLRIGHAPDNDVVLDSEFVSAHHAVVSVSNGEVEIQDLGSLNGTQLDGRPIRYEKRRPPFRFQLANAIDVRVAEEDSDELRLSPHVSAAGAGEPAAAVGDPTRRTEPQSDVGPAAKLANDLLERLATGDEPGPGTVLEAALAVVDETAGFVVAWRASGPTSTLDARGLPEGVDERLAEEIRTRVLGGALTGSLDGHSFAAHASPSSTLVLVILDGEDADVPLPPLVSALALCQKLEASRDGGLRTTRAPRSPFTLEIAGESLVQPVSFVMRALHERMTGALESSLPVLLTGETGVGKEIYARALHLQSSRGSKPWRPVNSSAIPEQLLEAMLFGAEEGAATGVRKQAGLLREAHGSTFFFDEIGEMSLGLQAKLLRALDTGEVLPVGASEPVQVDVRFIAATNRDLDTEVREGRFRKDLLYRLRAHVFDIPPLRLRRDDIPAFVNEFIKDECRKAGRHLQGVSVKAMNALIAHDWPGNARELRSLVQTLVHELPGGDVLRHEHLPAELREPSGTGSGQLGLDGELDRFQRELILGVLTDCGFHRVQAAQHLGVSRGRLRRLMERLGITDEGSTD